jgi:Toxin SymE, type I toxin-antitoxin system
MAIEDSTTARLSGAAARSAPQPAEAHTNPFWNPNVFGKTDVRPPGVKRTRREPPVDLRPRQIKMGESCYYDADGTSIPVPFLRLMGKWLERAGFPIDTNLRVTVEMGRLVIEPACPELIVKPASVCTRKRLVT